MPRKRPPIEEFVVTVTNWEKHNPPNPSVKFRPWFRMSADMVLDPKIYQLTNLEFRVYVLVLGRCSTQNGTTSVLNTHFCTSYVPGLGTKLVQCLNRLQQLQLLTYSPHRVNSPIRQTRQNNTYNTENSKAGPGKYVCINSNLEEENQKTEGIEAVSQKTEEGTLLGASLRLSESPPQIATRPPLPPIDAAALRECLEAWQLSMLRYGIKKDPKLDEVAIVRLIQTHGSQKTFLALIGIRYEPSSKDYDPKTNCHIRRFLKADNFERFVNLGSRQRGDGRDHDRTNEEILRDLRTKVPGYGEVPLPAPEWPDFSSLVENESLPGGAEAS